MRMILKDYKQLMKLMMKIKILKKNRMIVFFFLNPEVFFKKKNIKKITNKN